MRKLVCALIPIACFASEFTVDAAPPMQKANSSCPSFSGETTLSYLYWSPREDGLAFAVENGSPQAPLPDPNAQTTGRYVVPKGKWHSGFRIETSFAERSESFNQCGLSASWSYFRSESSAKAQTSDLADNPIVPNTIGSLSTGGFPYLLAESGQSKWSVRLNEFALNLEYLWQAARRIVFRPYVGAFGAIIDQTLSSSYQDITIANPLTATFDISTSNKVKFWGVGPSLGMGLTWSFWKSFRLIGNAYAAGLYGQFHTKSTINPPPLGIGYIFPNFNDMVYRLRPVFGSLLGFEIGGNATRSIGFFFSASYEWQYWPNQWKLYSNQFPYLLGVPYVEGDLSVQGLVASFKFTY